MATSMRKSLGKMPKVLHVRSTCTSWYFFLAVLSKVSIKWYDWTKFCVLQLMNSFDFFFVRVLFLNWTLSSTRLQNDIKVSLTLLLLTKCNLNICRPLFKCSYFYWLCFLRSFCLTSLLVCSPLPFTLVSSVSRLIQMRKKFRLLSSYSRWAPVGTKLGT